MTQVDTVRKTLQFRSSANENEELPYDTLVLAVGAANQAPEHTEPLATLADADRIRCKTVQAFEKAQALVRSGADDDAVRAALRFVVVGGAPESSEFAYRWSQFLRYLEKKQYPELAERGVATVCFVDQVLVLMCCLFDMRLSLVSGIPCS